MTPEPENVTVIRHVTERLAEAHPHVDADSMREAVRTAYEELRYARVRTYLPVLMERRAKDLLPSEDECRPRPNADGPK
ncbi:three-helix bundle dimerization domain-containing protein [Streptomyces sp. NPDC092307]|uniref:three-helix bundle dimerization domain-containing protein n=1 Tax=Streptomyces sp. NPDC092307 TaxID=3366013 RepID=UPI003806EE14